MAMRALNSFRTVSQLCRGNETVSAVRGASSGPAGQLDGPAPRAATARRASALAMLLRGRCRVDGVAPRAAPALPPLQRLCGSALGSTVCAVPGTSGPAAAHLLECRGGCSGEDARFRWLVF